MSDDPRHTFRQLIAIAGDDPGRKELADTPAQAVKAFATIFDGYKQDPAKLIEQWRVIADYKGLLTIKGIEFYSVCEQHFQLYKGVAHIGYGPRDGKLFTGIADVVDCLAHRLQNQAQLTEQIADTIHAGTKARGTAVIIEITNPCLICGGVTSRAGVQTTESFRGTCQHGADKDEFYRMLKV